MPDRPEGFVHRARGPSEQDARLNRFYRANQAEPEREFDRGVQRLIIDCLVKAAQPLGVELYAIGTERSHVHVVCGWRDARTGYDVRRSIKRSLSLTLNERAGRRTWFSRGGHVKQVRDAEHLSHLREKDVPSHPGWKWGPERGHYL